MLLRETEVPRDDVFSGGGGAAGEAGEAEEGEVTLPNADELLRRLEEFKRERFETE